jgi:Predicted transcriptional regulator, consists of a Zn-ribbon and ATP-cone domains
MTRQKQVHVKKTSGRYEFFDSEKLRDSLKRAGVSIIVIDDVAEEIAEEIKDGMHIDQIYARAFEILKQHDKRAALSYSLRRSIADMGPTGFPFEDFVGEIYKAKGYKVDHGRMLPGKCIEHEVDIIAYKDEEVILNEVKFHHKHDMKTDVKVAMYIKSRFDDLVGVDIELDGQVRKMTQGVLVTNTKLTLNAIKFGFCSGVNMISWNYPAKGNLHDLINETKLHPVTCLTVLSMHEKKILLDKFITTCQELLDNMDVLRDMGLKEDRLDAVQEEVGLLLLADKR